MGRQTGMTIREAMLREVETAYMDAQIEDDNDYSNWDAAIAKAIELGLTAQPGPPPTADVVDLLKFWDDWTDRQPEYQGDTLEAAVQLLVDAIERSKAPSQIIGRGSSVHLRLRHALRHRAAQPGPRAVVVPDEDPIDWENVLSTAICAYEDDEKADQGHGPLDTGWTSSYGDILAWWVKEYGAPAIAAALAQDGE